MQVEIILEEEKYVVEYSILQTTPYLEIGVKVEGKDGFDFRVDNYHLGSMVTNIEATKSTWLNLDIANKVLEDYRANK